MTGADTHKLIAEQDGAIGWLIFNNPARHNAVSLDMWRALPTLLDDLVADERVRVIVVRGAGEKAFISGADISEFETVRASNFDAYEDAYELAIESLFRAPKPKIAMINGYCMGGGVAVALGCDLRIASQKSRFAIPAAKLGVSYRVQAIRRLVEVVGASNTKEIFYTARAFTAPEALQMGWINRVAPEEALEGTVREAVAAIAAQQPDALVALREEVRALLEGPGGADAARREEPVATRPVP